MRDVAAFEHEVLHAHELDVIDIRATPLDQAGILAPLDALADELWQYRRRWQYWGGGHDYLSWDPWLAPAPAVVSFAAFVVRFGTLFFAACWIALTMCW